MATIDTDSQSQFTLLHERYYDDPEQLSQLLRQRAGTDHNSLHWTTSTPSHHSRDNPHPSAGGSVVANSTSDASTTRNAPSPRESVVRHENLRRAATRTEHVKPSLPTWVSLPIEGGVVQRCGKERLVKSFGDKMDAPGDTQPDSQMYKEWTSGIMGGGSHNQVNHARSLLNQIAENQRDQDDDADPPTDGPEFIGSSMEHHSPTVTSPTVIQDDEPETQIRTDALTSPLKFMTPALAGRKRDSQGQILSSGLRTVTTPGTALTTSAFPFAGLGGHEGMGNGMSLTQAFQATQAGTSPMVGAASEDAVFQRPSPNFVNIRPSSPLAVMSSPIKPARTDPPLRSSSEPRAEYVTMRQSQDRRSHDVEDEEVVEPLQDSWEEPSSLVKRVEARRKRELFDEEARKRLSKVAAPSLSPTSPRKKKGRGLKSLPKASPAVKKASRRLFSYDGPFEEGEEAVRNETSRPALSNGNGESEPPEELPQAITHVPRLTSLKTRQDKVQVPNTSSHPQRTLSGRTMRNSPPHSPSGQVEDESQTSLSGSQVRRSTSRKDAVIMDSQPDANTVPRPKSILPSSPSTNQYSINQTTMGRTGFTSQVVSSSVPPMPPKASSDDVADDDEEDLEERVPSSPPPLNDQDDEVQYDEHDYPDIPSSEDEEGEDTVRNRSAVDDVDMDAESVPESEDADYQDEDPQHVASVKSEQGDAEAQEEQSRAQQAEESAASGQPEAEKGPSRHPSHSQPRTQRQATVPESDLMEDTQPSLFAQDAVATSNNDVREAESAVDDTVAPHQTHSTEDFDTARENQSGSQPNPISNQDSRTPDRSAKSSAPQVKSFADIANQPQTQLTDIGEIDMPQFVDAFADEENDDFVAKVSASSPIHPPAKRRKITYSGKKKASLKFADDVDEDPHRPPESPLKRVHELAPSSTAEREQRGARAAAHAREEVASKPATKKSTVPTKPSKANAGRKGALKAVDKTLLHKSVSPAKTRSKRTSAATKATTEPQDSIDVGPEDTDMEDNDITVQETMDPVEAEPRTEEPAAEPTEEPAVDAEEPTGTVIVQNPSDRGEDPQGPVIAPNRIFAMWPTLGYHPATCLDQRTTNFKVRFDETTEFNLDGVHVRALDLRPGDQVKVDEKGMKKHTWVVLGLKDKIDPDHIEESPFTDRHGYATVVLEAKQRESLPKSRQAEDAEVVSVPLTRLYLTPQLWAKYRDRTFNFVQTSSRVASVAGTPTVADTSGTPRTSRRGASLLKDSIRAGSVTSSARGGSGSVFANMAFAITMGTNDSDRDAIQSLITSNGGDIVSDGFHELFDDAENDAPSSSKAKGKGKATGGDQTPTLKDEYKDLRFVALISDSYCRRSKYIQALALNIPAVHHRWLTDSIAANEPKPFANYLLPAGQSTYLDPKGVIRSRTMTLYTPGTDGYAFADIFASRDLLLENQSVLLVTGKSKGDKDSKNTYVFLAKALGAKIVGKCDDLAAASDLVQDGSWDWVYVSDGGKSNAQAVKRVEEAAHALFGTGTGIAAPMSSAVGKAKGGRKRKRAETEEEDMEADGAVGGSKGKGKNIVMRGLVEGKVVRVACDEFVVQSLILGALVEE